MALTATILRFYVDLSDVDSGVYETLEFQLAQHPSESQTYAVTRVLAMMLEYREHIEFGRGISVPDDPAVFQADATGTYKLWIEIGQPAAERLHKVTKLASDVKVYSHKPIEPTLAILESGNIHRGDEVVVVGLDSTFVNEVADALTKKNRWSILRSDGELYVTVGDATYQTTPRIVSS